MWATVRLMALALAVMGASCAPRAKADPIKSSPYSFDLTVQGVDIPDEGLEVVFDEEVLGRVKKNAPSLRVTLPADTYLVDHPGRLRVRVDGTCGKQEMLLRIPFSDRADETQAVRLATGRPTPFEVEHPTVARVFFDNEGAGATVLAVGARAVSVAAGERGSTTFFIGVCGTARDMFIAATKVGELPSPEMLSKGGGAATLVDLAGGRCYRYRTHTYGSDGLEKTPPKGGASAKADPKANAKMDPKAAAKVPGKADGKPSGKTDGKTDGKTADPASSDAIAKDGVLRGQRLYVVGAIDDFLSPSPKELAVHDDPRFLTRAELLRCDGKPITSVASAAAPPPTPAPTPPIAKPVAKAPPRPAPPKPPKKK